MGLRVFLFTYSDTFKFAEQTAMFTSG